MKILTHHHKYGDVHYRADTEEMELWAFYQMFTELDDFEAYTTGFENKKEEALYEKAKAGDRAAARQLCRRRKDAEYEGFEFDEVKEPDHCGKRGPQEVVNEGNVVGENSIEETPGVCGGRPVLAGTRIEMAHFQKLVEMGLSYEEILDQYPHLKPRAAVFHDAMGRWMNSTNWRLNDKEKKA